MSADSAMIDVLLVVLLIIPVGDLIAGIFFTRLFLRTKPREPGTDRRFLTRLLGGRSWLLFLLALDAFATSVVAAWVGYLAALRLTDRPLPDGTAPYLAITLIALGSVPIMFMIAFDRSRIRR